MNSKTSSWASWPPVEKDLNLTIGGLEDLLVRVKSDSLNVNLRPLSRIVITDVLCSSLECSNLTGAGHIVRGTTVTEPANAPLIDFLDAKSCYYQVKETKLCQ